MNITNYKIWTLTDGSEGMVSQVLGLAKEFSDDILEIKTNLYFPWSFLQPGILPINKWVFKNNLPIEEKPNLVISCGRKSVYLSIFLKKKYNDIINIHIQNPKISFDNFNYIVAPNHDMISCQNVINSIGALHKFSPTIITNTKDIKNLPSKNLISCIIGGQNNHYNFGPKEAESLCMKLLDLKKNNPEINLLIMSSRRTESSIKIIITNKLGELSNLWLGEGYNPYVFSLKYSSHFILTSDSTSMISESAITGKPIYIHHLPYKRISKRLESFHNEFRMLNITRDFVYTKSLSNWTYKPLNESKRISGIIKERIIEDSK